jgi:LysM repeat protein
MGKYTVSMNRVRNARTLPLLCAALLAAGCGSAPQHDNVPVYTSTPEPESIEATTIEPITSTDDARARAGSLSLRDDVPLSYVVKKGDTLWSISSFFLRDPWQWPELWYVNGKIANPHLIYPGEVLTLVMVNGHPRLASETSLSLERASPRVRVESLDDALPTIPIEAIRNFLRGPRVVTLEEANKAPYVVEFTDEHITGAEANGIYVKKLPEQVGPATFSWAVVQIGDPYRDPDTHELLGYEAIPAGEAEVRTPGSIAALDVTKSSREILIGDRLLPIDPENYGSSFYPHAPTTAVAGRILSVFDGLTQITQYQIVAINLGSNKGIDVGTVLQIDQAGRSVRDPYGTTAISLPDTYAGIMLVFKVTPKISYALVMKAERPIHVLDKVYRPSPSRR